MSVELNVAAAEIEKLPKAFRALARAARVTGEEVLRGEAGIILKACAGRTDVSTIAKADRRSALRSIRGLDLTSSTTPGDITVNAGIRGSFGRVWVRSSLAKPRRVARPSRPYRLAGTINRTSFAFRPERYHWKKGKWIDIVEAVADVAYQMRKAIPAGRKALGLARQSWVQIADSLGIKLETVKGGGSLSVAGIAKARRAIASNGRTYVNGLSTEEKSVKGIILTLINRYPRGRKMGMDSTLQGVLVGRARYFQQNLQRGVLASMTAVARAYPYLYVKN